MLTTTLAACVGNGPDDAVGTAEQNGAVGTAEQNGAVGTAEQNGAVGTAEQNGAVGTAEQDGAVGTAEQASTSCTTLDIFHYTYSDATGVYRWDATYNTGNAKWYIDERRIGGGFYKQYIVTPYWDPYVCYYVNSGQTIALTSGASTMTGTHTCVSNMREEI